MARRRRRREWFRLRSDMHNDHVIALLPDKVFRFWVLSLCATARYSENGRLPRPSDLAWWLRSGVAEVEKNIDLLVEAGLFIRKGGHVDIKNAAFHFGVSADLRLGASEWRPIRKAVFTRDDYTCHYCGVRGGKLECDHVIPLSRGGSNDMDNLVTACLACNRSKRDKMLEEWLS